jgi:hypothetical protein
MTAATTPDRGRVALEKLVNLLLPALAGHVQWTYQVLAVYPGPPVTVDLKAMAPNNPFGATLAGVTLWPGPDGGVALPTVGKLVLVRFNDTVTPAVCGLDPTDTPAIVYQYGGIVKVGDETAVPLVKAAPYAEFFAAVGDLAVALTNSGTPPPTTAVELAATLAAAGTALTTSLGLIAPPATTKALGT